MKYKTTEKDRYGNMRSIEITTDGQLEVPPMTSMIPQYEAVGGLAENHPGEPRGSDTVPAWLTPGEFVVNKEATDMYGPLIKKMNDEGRKVQDMKEPMYAKEGKKVDTSWITPDLLEKLAFIESDGIHRDISKAASPTLPIALVPTVSATVCIIPFSGGATGAGLGVYCARAIILFASSSSYGLANCITIIYLRHQ